MRFGASVPCFGDDPSWFAELAATAERAGWDGFFMWDHIRFRAHLEIPIVDPWVTLAACAVATERIRLGTLITPPARRRPAKLAKEVVTLDRLSKGRVILGVGLGWPPDADFAMLGDEGDDARRAEIFEESLEATIGLMSGRPFSFQGDHIRVDETVLLPGPVQERIPIWVGGTWPRRKPFRRAARYDGAVPTVFEEGDFRDLTPADLREIGTYLERQRGDLDGYELVAAGQSPADPDEARALVSDFAAAGATWFLEATDGTPGWWNDIGPTLEAGPPT